MSSFLTLPVEIIELIIRHLHDVSFHGNEPPINTADRPFPNHKAIKILLSLRLVGRAWATAIPTFVYDSLMLRSPWIDHYLLLMWKSCKNLHGGFSLRQMYFQQIICFPTTHLGGYYGALSDECREQFEYGHHRREPNIMYMHDAADIISLCGSKLTDLKLGFSRSIGFSNKLIDAIGHIKNLKVLFIEGNQVENHEDDYYSLVAVLSSVPSLESLSLKFATVSCLDLKPGCLPNLLHLWVTCHASNIGALNRFCADQCKQLKLLEYLPIDNSDQLDTMILTLQNNLQALSIDCIPSDIPRAVRSTSIPKLKVIRSTAISNKGTLPVWLPWSVFQTVQVFITDYDETSTYWHAVLGQVDKSFMERAQNLKHFIFLSRYGNLVKDPKLVEAFEAHGIACHFRFDTTLSELLYLQLSFSIALHREFCASLGEVGKKLIMTSVWRCLR
ncbi:uncharacterized protein MELLADRAFT_106673 [Melampsora larici-populina 98AG31]|uniref:F-box domain-containing protein n=1 Tax=Melampsora larici-populina (strain 98AG31 / pathotype 3-4-7) TaxID=747676 RepID=F4RM95_MELLP|nr:uncharacterized protein MELLADRAFT_106673 [Melampsora larici-populina 98AG31]EGG06383.1 hypothetical protein MELLADRAFT_106673 [Melampsora larici-populina 98AG31]